LSSGKRTRSREATSGAILQAATECFAEVGYDAATTRSIAERAGVSEGLIHRYFGSKEGLLVAIMRAFLHPGAGPPGLPSQPQQPLRLALRDYFDQAMQHHQDSAAAMRVLVSRAIIDPAVGSQMGQDLSQHHVQQLAEALRSYTDQEVESAAFVLSAFNFVIGFMAPHVFRFPPAQLQQISHWLADALADRLSSKGTGR
jgi:AcrR family transcriptional regulator